MAEGEHISLGPEGRERVLDKFYLDVQYGGTLFANLTESAENMMRDSELGLNQLEIEYRVQKAFQDYYVDMPADELKDRMMVVPLELMSDFIDTQLSVKDAVSWYTKLINRVTISMRPEHTITCLDYESIKASDACEYSLFCPRRKIGEHLEHLAMFTYDPVYEEECGRLYDDYDLARNKVALAARYGFIRQYDSRNILERHNERYFAYTQSIGRRAIEAPQQDNIS